MCQFCVQHGDGEKWYHEARNYAFDLTSDLRRRGYMLDFIREFDTHRAQAITGLGLLNALPAVVARPVRAKVERGLAANHFGQPVPLEDFDRIFDITTSIVRFPCICRRFAGTDEGAWCMAVSVQPDEVRDVLAEGFGSFTDGPDVSQFQSLTKAEALQMLRDAEERGLVHSVWTFVTPFTIAAVCNCDLASGCMAMRITRQLGTKIMWRGEYVAGIDVETCTGCKRCVAHCPFEAIDYERAARRARVRVEDCWGCGVCRAACMAGAIALHDRRAVPAVAAVW